MNDEGISAPMAAPMRAPTPSFEIIRPEPERPGCRTNEALGTGRLTNGDEFLTLAQAGALVHVSAKTVERWRVKYNLPHYNLNRDGRKRIMRVKRSKFLAWFEKTFASRGGGT